MILKNKVPLSYKDSSVHSKLLLNNTLGAQQDCCYNGRTDRGTDNTICRGRFAPDKSTKLILEYPGNDNLFFLHCSLMVAAVVSATVNPSGMSGRYFI